MFCGYKLGDDEAILRQITAANVACGWHAGDPMVMDKVVRMASERGVVDVYKRQVQRLKISRQKM